MLADLRRSGPRSMIAGTGVSRIRMRVSRGANIMRSVVVRRPARWRPAEVALSLRKTADTETKHERNREDKRFHWSSNRCIYRRHLKIVIAFAVTWRQYNDPAGGNADVRKTAVG